MQSFLGWIERTGNKLPDPVFIFFYLIIALMGASMLCASMEVSAPHPTKLGADGAPLILAATSLLSAENIQKLWSRPVHIRPILDEKPRLWTHDGAEFTEGKFE